MRCDREKANCKWIHSWCEIKKKSAKSKDREEKINDTSRSAKLGKYEAPPAVKNKAHSYQMRWMRATPRHWAEASVVGSRKICQCAQLFGWLRLCAKLETSMP